MPNIWEPRKVIETRYRQSLYELVDFFIETLTGADLAKPGNVIELFQQFAQSKAFADYANILSTRMVTGLAVEGAKSWREAARRSMRGQTIFESLRQELKGPVGRKVQELVDANAKLISSFPESIANQVANWIARESQKGRRPEEVAKDLMQNFPDLTRNRIKLIARTETAKANSALVQAQAEDVDLDWYVWHTSEDARVRYAHRKMDGVLVSWAQPPNPERLFPEKGVKPTGPYHAGCIYNCRCYAAILVQPSQVSWPHRVFWGGRVQMMTRAQWDRIAKWKKAA